MTTSSNPLVPFGDPDANTWLNRDDDIVPADETIPPQSFFDLNLKRALERERDKKRSNFSTEVKNLVMRGNALYAESDFPVRGADPVIWIHYQEVVLIDWNDVEFHHLRQLEDTEPESCTPLSTRGHKLYHTILSGIAVPPDLAPPDRYDCIDSLVEMDMANKKARDFMERKARWIANNYLPIALNSGPSVFPGLYDL